MANLRSLIGALSALILLSGCGDQRILERTGFIQSTSYDLLPDGKIKYALSVPISNPDVKKTNARLFLITETTGGKKARIELAKQTNLLLVSGQLRTTLFGMSVAKKGMWHYMDTLLRDPTIAEQTKIIIVTGDAGSLLSKDYPGNPRTGKYIDRLIDKEAQGQTIPKTTIYSFSRDYYDDGVDPIAPMLKDVGSRIAVDGIALFQDDRYKGKINPEDSLIFFFLKTNFKQGEISLDLPDQPKPNTTIMLSSMNSSRKVNVELEKSGLITVNIRVKALASVLEYNGGQELSDNSVKQQIERKISEIVTERAERIIQMLQEKRTDSLGIGIYVRNSMTHQNWKKTNWREAYPNVKINCDIKLKIKEQGFLQ